MQEGVSPMCNSFQGLYIQCHTPDDGCKKRPKHVEQSRSEIKVTPLLHPVGLFNNEVEKVYCSLWTYLLHEIRFVFKGEKLSRNYTAYLSHHYSLAHYTRIGNSYFYELI